MSPAPCQNTRTGSEFRPAAEAEPLRAVVARLGNRHRKIEPQRSQRGIPDQANTNRRTDQFVIADLQGFTRYAPGCRPFVIPKRAGIREGGQLDADFLREEVKRRLQFDAAAPIQRTAKSVLCRRGQVARTDTGRLEAANEVRAHLKMVERAHIVAAPSRDVAALQFSNADNVREHFVI